MIKKNTIELAIADLFKADRVIKKKSRYFCGLVSEEVRKQVGCGDYFFESPDGQNGQLYYELRKLGYSGGGFKAEYYWTISKNGIQISYTEGDISISLIK